MTLDINIGDGADALTINQLTDALDGTYWVEGWEATLGDGDLEVDIAPGEGAIGTIEVETESTQTVDFAEDVDADEPRKAVISVDDTGTVQKTVGDAMPADPENEVRFRTFDPAPPDSAPGIVVAEVWLGADISTLISDDLRERPVPNQAASGLSSFLFTTSGYVDVENDRELDTEYQNTTGNPLQVQIVVRVDDTDEFSSTQLRTDTEPGMTGGDKITEWRGPQNGEFWSMTHSGIIPDGWYYSVSDSNVSLETWKEQELIVE